MEAPGARSRWLEPRILGAIAAASAALWAFIELADEVVEGETRAIDRAVLVFLRGEGAGPVGPRWFEELARDLTALGGVGVLGLLVAAAAGFLWLAGRRPTALFVVAATAGGALATHLLKLAFDRPRPDILEHGAHVTSASFPSGHAMLSAVVYLTLAALVARLLPAARLKLYVIGVAAGLSLLAGLTRVYLGVHWPSDVLAGWAAGAAWALGCWAVAQGVHLGAHRGP